MEALVSGGVSDTLISSLDFSHEGVARYILLSSRHCLSQPKVAIGGIQRPPVFFDSGLPMLRCWKLHRAALPSHL